MKLIHDLEKLHAIAQPVVLTIGSFDGVHKGHQSLITRATEEAKKLKGEAWVLTFDPHPTKVLAPHHAPELITTINHQQKLFKALGLDGCLLLNFSHQVAQLEPEEFLETLVQHFPKLAMIIVGQNWRFGAKARGDIKLLKKAAHAYGFQTIIASSTCDTHGPISSTRIRRAIAAGELDNVSEWLGRPFSLLGTVVSGNKLGRAIGFPTANFNVGNEVLPPAGIYAVYAPIQNKTIIAAAYLGKRPTLEESKARILFEVHFLDCSLDLYDMELEVFFMCQNKRR